MRLTLASLLTIMMISANMPAIAQAFTDVPASCDQEFLDVMEARAWMEGKREMEVAQRLILKPDSVLEYSCFEQRASQLQNADFFTQSERQFDLRILVTAALSAYLNNNFGHDYGGGTIDGGSGCSVMNHVWTQLKCVDANKDLYVTFADLVSSDPRNEPAPCAEPSRSPKWSAALAVTAPVPAVPPNNGGVESVDSFMAKLDPDNCAASVAFPTGAMILNYEDSSTYEEYVCSAPGCTYNGTSCE